VGKAGKKINRQPRLSNRSETGGLEEKVTTTNEKKKQTAGPWQIRTPRAPRNISVTTNPPVHSEEKGKTKLWETEGSFPDGKRTGFLRRPPRRKMKPRGGKKRRWQEKKEKKEDRGKNECRSKRKKKHANRAPGKIGSLKNPLNKKKKIKRWRGFVKWKKNAC